MYAIRNFYPIVSYCKNNGLPLVKENIKAYVIEAMLQYYDVAGFPVEQLEEEFEVMPLSKLYRTYDEMYA